MNGIGQMKGYEGAAGHKGQGPVLNTFNLKYLLDVHMEMSISQLMYKLEIH